MDELKELNIALSCSGPTDHVTIGPNRFLHEPFVTLQVKVVCQAISSPHAMASIAFGSYPEAPRKFFITSASVILYE